VTLETALLLCWINTCCKVERVNPAFVKAVFSTESGDSRHKFRFGPLGKKGQYIGPAGIDKSFRSKWDIDFWPENVRRGVLALKPRGREKTERDVLRRYNAKFNSAYFRAVMTAKRHYAQQLKGE
jgi:hypothetical protein